MATGQTNPSRQVASFRDGAVRLAIRRRHLGALVVGKAADATTTVFALSLAPATLVEATPLATEAVGALGPVRGTVLLAVLSVAGLSAAIEAGAAVLERARIELGEPVSARWAWGFRTACYYFAGGLFGWLALGNLAVALGVVG
jgi:hypothetical protein